MVISEECKQQILTKSNFRGKVLKTVLLITSFLLPKVQTRWYSVIENRNLKEKNTTQNTMYSGNPVQFSTGNHIKHNCFMLFRGP